MRPCFAPGPCCAAERGAGMQSHPSDDEWSDCVEEPTAVCRYVLLDESESGQISVREPHTEPAGKDSPQPSHVVLVKRPSVPPAAGSALQVDVFRRLES